MHLVAFSVSSVTFSFGSFMKTAVLPAQDQPLDLGKWKRETCSGPAETKPHVMPGIADTSVLPGPVGDVRGQARNAWCCAGHPKDAREVVSNL